MSTYLVVLFLSILDISIMQKWHVSYGISCCCLTCRNEDDSVARMKAAEEALAAKKKVITSSGTRYENFDRLVR